MASRARDLRRRLITPEGVDLGVVLGEIGQRASAFLLDAIVLIGALIALTLIAVFGIYGAGLGALQPVAIIWLLGFFVLRNGYFIIMEMRPRAATLGKRWSGLRVVARDGGRLTGDAVIARNLMREIEVFLPLSLLAGGSASGDVDGLTAVFGLGWTGIFLLFPYFNADRMRVGDLLAGTWVIQTRPKKLIADLAPSTASTFLFDAKALDAYGVYELDTLANVIRTGDADARLAVTQAIIDRIGWSREVRDIDGFLNAYYIQLRAHLEGALLMGRRRETKHDAGTQRDTAYQFSAAQLAVYGPAERQKLSEVLRLDDPIVQASVARAIATKIGWQGAVNDSAAFVKAYHAELASRPISGLSKN